ncbi:extracellular solute-binding protein [Quadrisphaera setariae]|uniref:sugar ABC transporter substrate-binding protein n=1 Tax=Quadrisphaera setariae TaxID=2593304 RepID=UPI001C9BDD72|nr:extracellular solute-binding protein [Quadrisphaera setariae]
MKTQTSPTRRARRTSVAVALAAVTTLALSACGGGSTGTSDAGASGSGAAASGTYTVWDPYPQFDDSSDWVKLLQKCGTDNGVTVKRTGYDTTDLTNKALLAAQQGTSPDVILIDNPVISTLADAGALTDTQTLGLDTSAFEKNLIAAGEVDGKTYGVPIGANTLSLYYNKAVLDAAGVDPASVKDWASLTAALEKVKAAGKKGITFSAIGTEEGSFQFLPWFWGSGADLTKLDSSQGVAALSLWKDWLDKGYAPNSVLNNTQTTSWQEFATGDYAFSENGTWQLGNAKKTGFEWGVIPIPAENGGVAPAPTGGEFAAAPVQTDTARYATTSKLISCLTSPDNALATDTTLSYIGATQAVQEKQAADPELKPWVEAVQGAKGRTSDNLGTKYPKISEQLWDAVQAALSGSKTPQQAMSDAQTAAASATS